MAAKEDEYELAQILLNALNQWNDVLDNREQARIKRSEEEAIRRHNAVVREQEESKLEHEQEKRWHEESKMVKNQK
jgi:hypothetical protein